MEIKGIVHAHSAYSYDGKVDLRSLRDFLIEKGISFCCVTEHTDTLTLDEAQRFIQECRALSGSQFVFVPGFEVPYKDAHILLIGTELFLGQVADASMLKQWSSRASLTVLAHPVRNRFVLDETMKEVIDGIEIWNQQYDGKLMPRTRSAALLRTLQAEKQSLVAFGGSDFHRYEHFGAPVYSLSVEHLTIDAIIEVLRSGQYVFGTHKRAVSSIGLWKGSDTVLHRAISAASIAVIQTGKTVNKLLARFGLKLPKQFAQIIRSRV